MRDLVKRFACGLQALLIAAAFASAVHADPCDNDKSAERERSADRAMAQAQRQAERAQRIAEQIARQAQNNAEMAAARARWAAEHASEAAQLEAERVQAEAELAAARAQRRAERVAQAAERAAERAAIGAPGVVVTNDAILFIDGPEVRRDDMEWANDVRSRRMRQPITTDTTLRVNPGITLSLANISGDIMVRVWDRNEVRVNLEHDRSDRFVAVTKDGLLRLGVSSRDGGPADVEWNLTVPMWMPLELKGLESEIAVTGARAGVIAKSLRGDVHISSCQGPMELNSVEGDVHAEDVSGDVNASSVNNAVRLVRVRGDIAAQSVNGDVQMDNVSSMSVSASTLNGKIYYASKLQKLGRYNLSSHNGTVYVGVDNLQPMNVTVSSFNGQLESSIPLPPAPPEAPTPPTPPTPPAVTSWKTWKWSWPTEAATESSSSASPSAPRSPSARKMMKFTPRPAAAPRAPELELESFGGLIRLASTAEIERALALRQAMRDSAEATRTLMRLRRQARIHAHPAPESRPSENPDKD